MHMAKVFAFALFVAVSTSTVFAAEVTEQGAELCKKEEVVEVQTEANVQ